MPTHHCMQLRFVRKGDLPGSTAPPSEDDVMRVVKLGENSVRVVYTEKSTDGMMIDTMQFSYTQFIAYLHRVFWLLSLDDDPFESVNIAVPGHPVVIIKVETLQRNVPHLLELILHTCYSWPAIGRAEPTAAATQPVATVAPPPTNIENID
jgi:hypothetical protein